MTIPRSLALTPLIALIAGVLILMMPRLLNYIVALYLIVVGLLGFSAARRLSESQATSSTTVVRVRDRARHEEIGRFGVAMKRRPRLRSDLRTSGSDRIDLAAFNFL